MRIWLDVDNNKRWHGDQPDDAQVGDTITVAGVGYTCTYTNGAEALFKRTDKLKGKRDAVTGNIAMNAPMPASHVANAAAGNDTRKASALQRAANEGEGLENEAQQEILDDLDSKRTEAKAPVVVAPVAKVDVPAKTKDK